MGVPGSGRRPLPSSIKKLRGNPGKRKLNAEEPKLETKAPRMPDGLPELARQEWEDIVPLLLRLGVLSELDGKALAAYCYCFARWMQAEKEIEARGLLLDEPILDAEGQLVGTRPKTNPAVGIADRAVARMKSYLVEFGLTPASRSRLRIEKPKEIDPMEAYLNRRRQNAAPTIN